MTKKTFPIFETMYKFETGENSRMTKKEMYELIDDRVESSLIFSGIEHGLQVDKIYVNFYDLFVSFSIDYEDNFIYSNHLDSVECFRTEKYIIIIKKKALDLSDMLLEWFSFYINFSKVLR